MQMELSFEEVEEHWGLAELGPLLWHVVLGAETVSLCGQRKVIWRDLPAWLPKFKTADSCRACAARLSAKKPGLWQDGAEIVVTEQLPLPMRG